MAWVPLGEGCECVCGCAACETVAADWTMPFEFNASAAVLWMPLEVPELLEDFADCYQIVNSDGFSSLDVNPFCRFGFGPDEWLECMTITRTGGAVSLDVEWTVVWNGFTNDWDFTGVTVSEVAAFTKENWLYVPESGDLICQCTTEHLWAINGSGTCELQTNANDVEYNLFLAIGTAIDDSYTENEGDGCGDVDTSSDCEATDTHGCFTEEATSVFLYYRFTRFECDGTITAILVDTIEDPTNPLTGVTWPEELTLTAA